MQRTSNGDGTDQEPRRREPEERARYLARLSYVEIEEYLQTSDIVLVPCGATEQHGEHLPVGVDAMTAIAVTEDAAIATGAMIAPPIWYGWSPQHMGFAGTVSLRPETLTALAEDIAISLLHHGFTRIVFVNGHRLANLPPLSTASTQTRAATGALIVVADLGHLAQPEYSHAVQHEGAGGIGHADGYETAHMMHLHPDLVATEKVPHSAADTGQPSLRVIDPSVASSRAAWWPSTEAELVASGNGASGNPSWGNVERGRTLHAAMVRDLVALVGQVQAVPVDVVTSNARR